MAQTIGGCYEEVLVCKACKKTNSSRRLLDELKTGTIGRLYGGGGKGIIYRYILLQKQSKNISSKKWVAFKIGAFSEWVGI